MSLVFRFMKSMIVASKSMSRFLIVVTLVCLGCGSSAIADEPVTLSQVAEIRSLSREQAAKGVRVKLKGTVSYRARGGRTFILYDGKEGISVHVFRAKELGVWKGGRPREAENEVGALIEIEGVTGPAGYSPVIIPERFRRVGEGTMPEPRRVSMERLISGSEVSQRVLVEGIVQRSVLVEDGKWAMTVVVEGHPCEVDFQSAQGFDSSRTLDGRVQVRGFSSPVFNLRSESTRLRLLAWGAEDVTVVEPPPAEPFAGRRLPLNGLLPFSKEPDRFRRKVTSGVVNFAWPGRFFFLQDGNAGLLVESSSKDLQVGDRVEAAGFVEVANGIAALTEAVTRRVGTAEPPLATAVSASELLLPEIAGRVEAVVNVDHFDRLVEIRGGLRQIERSSREGHWTLYLTSGGEVFRAYLPMPNVTWQPPWQAGSEVAIRGVCEPEFMPRKPGTNSPTISGFHLWLRNPGDVTITKAAPWWTPGRLWLALGGIAVVLAFALIWNLLLHRKVDKQMTVISSKLRSETIHHERNRLARDLHDTLEQHLVGVALQLDDAEQIIRHDPKSASEIVTLARRMLRHTRSEARRSVWDLRSEVLETEGLGPALEILAQGVASSSGPVVDVRIDPNYHSFPLDTEFQLFRIAQEALANALKHAGASHVVIALEAGPDATCLSIADDGLGFSPGSLDRLSGSHFGLLGMQERAERIGSRLTSDADRNSGCCISVRLPRSGISNLESHSS